MMTLHTLYAGSGYTYLTDSVASGDRELQPGQSLANYYSSDKGTPAGQWTGAGAQRLGVTGEVTEAHMLALFGEGIHPKADEIIAQEIDNGRGARQALRSAKIGRVFSSNIKDGDPMIATIEERIRLERVKNDGSLSAEKRREVVLSVASKEWEQRFPGEQTTDKQLVQWAARIKREQGEAVAGFDLVFTPQKSITTLWGVGDDELRDAISGAHNEAVSETLSWLESNVAFSRKGQGGVLRVEGDGLIVARFDHFDNRAGDPNLHTHCAVANKIYCPDDGKWRSLDGRAMFQMNVAASNLYNQTITNKLRNRGLAFHATSRGEGKSPVYEVAGVPDSLLREFSRRDVIQARLDELVADFRERNHREPSTTTQIKLAQQATLETRGAKSGQESLEQMRQRWAHRASQVLGVDDVQSTLKDLVKGSVEETERLDVMTAADRTLELLERRRSQWNVSNIYSAATESVASVHFSSSSEQNAMIEAVMSEVRDNRSIMLTGQRYEDLSALTTTQGKSLFHQSMTTKFTSPEMIFREQKLLDATRMATPYVATRSHIDATIASVEKANGFAMNEGQRRMAHWLLGSGAQLSVAVGPAGAGKTTSMKAVSDAWQGMGYNVVGLGPSAAAANVLGNDLGINGQTIASVLTRDKHGLDTGISQGTLIIVDEAGMASTRDLFQLNEIAQRQGAVVRMIGDPAQLSAVESGGMLEVLAHETNAPSLDDVVRFKTEGEDKASLLIREGDASSFEFYNDNDRIHTGSADSLRDSILSAWAADTAADKTSLMLATTRRDVDALNKAAQAQRLQAGELAALSQPIQSRDGAVLSIGDRIVTRKNDSTITMLGGEENGRRIFNGDLWTVDAMDDSGSLHVTHTSTGGRAVLPAAYVEENVELGYASTVHRAQGMTVDSSHMLISGHESRELAYVGMSRGKQSNHAWIVTEQTIDPEAEHDSRTPANAEAVWEQVMSRGSDNKAALASISERDDEPAVLMDAYAHVRESLVRSWTTELTNTYLPLHAEMITDHQHDQLAKAVGIALDSTADIERLFTDAGSNSTASVDDIVGRLCAGLEENHAQQSISILPPAAQSVDAQALEWARTARMQLLDERRSNAERLAALGEGLTPRRVSAVSTEVLSEQAAVISARRKATETVVARMDEISAGMSAGDPHRRLLGAHATVLHHDRLIDRVLNYRETLHTATGYRHRQLSREIAALEQALPPAEKWAEIGQAATVARREVAQAVQTERKLSAEIGEKANSARHDLVTMRRTESVITDELSRRQTLSDDELAAEKSQWGTQDAGLTVARSQESRAAREHAATVATESLPTAEQVSRMLLDADSMATAPESIVARIQSAADAVERAEVDRIRPEKDTSGLDVLISQRRTLESQLEKLSTSTADPAPSNARIRDRIRQAQAAEPTLLADLERAHKQLAVAENHQDTLPAVPTGIFASAEKIQDITTLHKAAEKRVQTARSAVNILKNQHRQLLEQLPPRSEWKDILNAKPATTDASKAFAIRTQINDLDTRIGAIRASTDSNKDKAMRTQPDQHTRTHSKNISNRNSYEL